MSTPREIAERIFAEIGAIPVNHFGDSHRSRRCRLKKKRLAEIASQPDLPKGYLYAVKAHLENLLQANRTGNNKAWGEQNAAFFRKRG